jgi:UDP-2-acetamido-2,6-beta-L-arabino-hexul-4-ose reductase
MRVLITGARGFIGRNLCATLVRNPEFQVLPFDLEDDPSHLQGLLLEADVLVHLAGVNRPPRIEDFQSGNADFTQYLLRLLEEAGRPIPVLLSSSTQAAQDNPYGLSKRQAEEAVFEYGERTGVPVHVYRLPNVFGKWCRPQYNSAVATFCHNIARGLEIQVNDPAAPLRLVYIDDVVTEFLRGLDGSPSRDGRFCAVPTTHETTVGSVVELLRGFQRSRADLSLPLFSDPLQKKLFATYLSYLPEDGFAYPLTMHEDARGSFTEFLRTADRGQVSVNVSRPGITKGNHWHHTKHEKFLVVSGTAAIRFRKVGETQVISYEVAGDRLTVVDIPPGFTHSITNTGDQDLVTVMWVSEPFDPTRPDTWFEEV